NERIARQRARISALVVAIGHTDDAEPRGARREHIGERVPDHERLTRPDPQLLTGPQQPLRMRLAVRDAVPAPHRPDRSRRTQAGASSGSPCSASARFKATLMSAAVSSSVPSRSNSTARTDRTPELAAPSVFTATARHAPERARAHTPPRA